MWSKFPFQIRACYQCTPLLDIYNLKDNHTSTDLKPNCLDQLQNQKVANLLNTNWAGEASGDDLLNEEIANLKTLFTMVGLMEKFNMTVQISGHAFPWMQKHVQWSNTTCEFPHANASPKYSK
jgi:hypothetical protein